MYSRGEASCEAVTRWMERTVTTLCSPVIDFGHSPCVKISLGASLCRRNVLRDVAWPSVRVRGNNRSVVMLLLDSRSHRRGRSACARAETRTVEGNLGRIQASVTTMEEVAISTDSGEAFPLPESCSSWNCGVIEDVGSRGSAPARTQRAQLLEKRKDAVAHRHTLVNTRGMGLADPAGASSRVRVLFSRIPRAGGV